MKPSLPPVRQPKVPTTVRIKQLFAVVTDPHTNTDIFVPVDRYDALQGEVRI